jgi:hypothetical protein
MPLDGLQGCESHERSTGTDVDLKNKYLAPGLGFSHAYRGRALIRAGQPSQAAADLRRAVESRD